MTEDTWRASALPLRASAPPAKAADDTDTADTAGGGAEAYRYGYGAAVVARITSQLAATRQLAGITVVAVEHELVLARAGEDVGELTKPEAQHGVQAEWRAGGQPEAADAEELEGAVRVRGGAAAG